MSTEAIASFQKAIELKPDFANAYQNLVYTVIGDDEKAVSEINALRKTKPDDATKLIEARKKGLQKQFLTGKMASGITKRYYSGSGNEGCL
jgi:uncharacterized protein YpiB (UPF0302 family)